MYIQIMIIDSDLSAAKQLKYYLQNETVRAYYTTSVQEGITHLAHFCYQIVVIDVSSWETDGLKQLKRIYALLRRSRKLEPPYNAPPILSSDNKLLINPGRRKVILLDTVISLPRKQFEQIYLLAGNPGRIFTREQLYEKVGGRAGEQ